MKAKEYIALNKLRKQLNTYENDLFGSRLGLCVCIGLSILSVFTLDWTCVLAAAIAMTIPVTAMLLTERQVEEMKERIFQWQLEHSKYWFN